MFGLRVKKPAPAEIAGVRVRVSARARRMALRVDAKSGEVVLTWPGRGVSEASARRFVEENKAWIDSSRKKITPKKMFCDGDTLSVHGKDYKITRQDGRGLTRFKEDFLVVHGKPEHLSRRLRDFLKEYARRVLEEATEAKLTDIGRKLRPIRVIDPKTRWGSCGPDGRLMFSWRLILAPPDVLDYVVAHEVAHRVHMNHSRKFWELCSSLTPDATASKRWLKKHGPEIMAYQ